MGRSSVFEWISKYCKGELAAISTKFASGRPTVLDDSEMIRLYTMINGKGPRVYSFGLALRTRALIRDLIKKTFGKDGRAGHGGADTQEARNVSAAAVVPVVEARSRAGGPVKRTAHLGQRPRGTIHPQHWAFSLLRTLISLAIPGCRAGPSTLHRPPKRLLSARAAPLRAPNLTKLMSSKLAYEG